MKPPNNPPAVHANVAGKVELRTRDVQRLLGPVAWSVWVYLLRCRNRDGSTRARTSTIAEARGHSERQVRRALKRLAAAGLTEWLGWQHGRPGQKKSRTRRILGDFRNGQVTLPRESARQVNELRPKGRPNSLPVAIETPRSLPPKMRAPFSKMRAPFSLNAGTIQTPGSENTARQYGDLHLMSKVPVIVRSKINSVDGSNEPSKKYGEAAVPLVLSVEDKLAIARLLEPGGPVIPRPPTTRTMKCARVPSPPSIPEGASDLDAVWLMVKAYRGTYEARFDEACFAFASGELHESRYYRQLRACAETMRDYDIPPGGWAPFAFDVWKSHFAQGAAKNKPPPITFVFSNSSLTKWRGWFRGSQNNYSGGVVLFNTIQKQVLERYAAVKQLARPRLFKLEKAGRLSLDTARKELDSLVEEWFPGGYADWIHRASERGADDKRRIKRMVSEGEYVWS